MQRVGYKRAMNQMETTEIVLFMDKKQLYLFCKGYAFGSRKIMGPENSLGSKIILGAKKFLVPKNFGSLSLSTIPFRHPPVNDNDTTAIETDVSGRVSRVILTENNTTSLPNLQVRSCKIQVKLDFKLGRVWQ